MTNGEKIENTFPNVEISPDPYSPSVDIYIGGIMMMRVDRNWWNAEYKEPMKGHWKLVQRGKWIDICCSNCEAVRIKGCAYNYTIDQLEEDFKEFLKNGDMKYCPYCGSDNREVKE